MLKKIKHVGCSSALEKCFLMMQKLVHWLADANITAAHVTKQNLAIPFAEKIEVDWLWSFLEKKVDKRSLLSRAETVASLSAQEKAALRAWVSAFADIKLQFEPNPPNALPIARPVGKNSRDPKWNDLKVLLVSFYEVGLKIGLPYKEDGTATADQAERVTGELFLDQFRDAHRTVQDKKAREVCVLCGGELIQPQTDHWILKASIPLLAVCDTNLLPCCSACNERPNKGTKTVYTGGRFTDWYHPYLRHPNGSLKLGYDRVAFEVTISSTQPSDAPKAQNLDDLLNLRERWTQEFKAEDTKVRRQIQDMRARGLGPITRAEVSTFLTGYSNGLLHSEPDYEVHVLVAQNLLDPNVIAALAV
jgi:hypothetical protein